MIRTLVAGVAVAQASGVPQWLTCDHVDDPTDGICAEECRAPSSDYLHTFDHRGRDLLQTIYSCQCTEYGATIDKDLRIGTFESVDTYLVEPTVLTVILYSKSRLEAQALAEVIGVSFLEDLLRKYRNKARSTPTHSLVSIGRDDHTI